MDVNQVRITYKITVKRVDYEMKKFRFLLCNIKKL